MSLAFQWAVVGGLFVSYIVFVFWFQAYTDGRRQRGEPCLLWHVWDIPYTGFYGDEMRQCKLCPSRQVRLGRRWTKAVV